MSSCPISHERINEKSARIAGILTFAIVLAYLFLPHPVWLLFLVYDFSFRSFYKSLSPIAILSQTFAPLFGKPQIVDGAPKRFAAKIGLAMSVLALICYFMTFFKAAVAILIVMGICAFLEGAFGYCVGCKLYTLKRRFAL